MCGDIDITVVGEDPYSTDKILEIFGELYKLGKFRSYFIAGDWDDPRKGSEFPDGKYIGLKQKKGSERWKVDIWFLDKEAYKKRSSDFDMSHIELSDEQRVNILNIKKQRNDQKIDIGSYEIYQAVLKNNTQDISEV